MHGLSGDTVQSAAWTALDARLDRGGTAPIAVALSGGGDSLCALHLTAAWARAHGRPVVALTVDHGLNPDSTAWTEKACEMARAVGAAHRALLWEGEKPLRGIPAAARMARHRVLAEAARALGAKVIVTGHTLSDVAENGVLRAGEAPGMGRLRGWGPSPVWPQGRGLMLLRPLLALSRADIRQWLAAQGLSHIDDPANDDPRQPRARARQAIGTGPLQIKVAPDLPMHLAAGVITTPDGRLILPAHVIAAPEATILLTHALLCVSGGEVPTRREGVEALVQRLRRGEPGPLALGGCRIGREGGRAVISRNAGEARRGGLAPIALNFDAETIWDGRFAFAPTTGPATVAPAQGRMSSLSPADRTALRDLPPSARAALPVVLSGGTSALPAPFGTGPVAARSLVRHRFAASTSLIQHERDI